MEMTPPERQRVNPYFTGGETIQARFMRQDNFHFRPTFKLFIVGNHRPELRNVDDADAVLVVSQGAIASRGTVLALERAEFLRKPWVAIDLRSGHAPTRFEAFVTSLRPGCALNVAGPRESEQPGIYAASRQFLDAHAWPLRWA